MLWRGQVEDQSDQADWSDESEEESEVVRVVKELEVGGVNRRPAEAEVGWLV